MFFQISSQAFRVSPLNLSRIVSSESKRYPSFLAKPVAKVDFPEPEAPVTKMTRDTRFLGRRSIFFCIFPTLDRYLPDRAEANSIRETACKTDDIDSRGRDGTYIATARMQEGKVDIAQSQEHNHDDCGDSSQKCTG